MNYPTEDYESYADCDDDFVKRSLPPGYQPFWAVDNISDASHDFYLESDYYTYVLKVEVEGMHYAVC